MPIRMADEEEVNGDEPQTFVVRIRGLPWSAAEEDIKNFFENSPEVTEIHFTYNREGRMSGEAYVVFASKMGFSAALSKDHEKIGHRYIEVFPSKKSEMDYILKARGKPEQAIQEFEENDSEPVMRLRGLPFGTTKEEIIDFFDEVPLKPEKICLPNDHSGRPTGEAFVQLESKDQADLCLKKHMKNIQHRYIEVFRSSADEVRAVSRRVQSGGGPVYGGQGARPGPYDRGGRGSRGGAAQGYGGGYGNYGGGYGGYGGYGEMGGYGGYGGWGGGWGGYGDEWASGAWGGPSMGRGGASGMRGRGGWGRGGMGGGMGGGWKGSGWDEDEGTPGSGSTRHFVKIRGIPYNSTESDVSDFCSPLPVLNVEILKEFRSNRPSGEARVEFYSHEDAKACMKKDREYMGTRYVELFLMSNPGPKKFMGGMGSMGNSGYMDFSQ